MSEYLEVLDLLSFMIGLAGACAIVAGGVFAGYGIALEVFQLYGFFEVGVLALVAGSVALAIGIVAHEAYEKLT